MPNDNDAATGAIDKRMKVNEVVALGDVRLRSLTLESLLDICAQGFVHVVTVNAEIFVLAHENAAYGAILQETINTVDGTVVAWLASLRAGHHIRKLAGADLLLPLAVRSAQCGHRMFLLGGSAHANALALERLRRTAPGLAIDGLAPDPSELSGKNGDEIIERVLAFRPQYLAVCLGPPKQEYWIARYSTHLRDHGVQLAIGLGGTVDFVAGTVRRAPLIVQRVGLEWLFRVAIQPRTRFRRTLKMFWMPIYAFSSFHRWRPVVRQAQGSRPLERDA